MASNTKLLKAKKQKDDCFYTLLENIEKELQHYDLRGKTIYSPASDYRHSNFTKYFVDNFERLGITRYCCTNYDNGNGAWKYEYDGENTTITKLEGNGDFRSPECTSIKDEYDIIIDNPPFSLNRDFIKWLGEKDFLIISTFNLLSCKDIFPLIQQDKIHSGYKSWNGGMDFISKKGELCNIRGIIWLTTLPVRDKRQLNLAKQYLPGEYKLYDNTNIINVDKIKDIPYNYIDKMGVPISVLQYDLSEYDILTMANGGYRKINPFNINGKPTYVRIIIRKKIKDYIV